VQDEGISYLLGELVSVAAVSVDVAQGSGGSSVVEEVHESVDTFRVAKMEAVRSSIITLGM
jgi:hypothetical protein